MDTPEVPAATNLVAAGLVLVAADTGRVLMLQRALDEEDPASGCWEFPGGCLEPGETAAVAAHREWAEEVGQPVPDSTPVGGWTSDNGVYEAIVEVIASEDLVAINADQRPVVNPDDPDGDEIETVAWMSIDHAREFQGLRPECAASTDWDLLAKAPMLAGAGKEKTAMDKTTEAFPGGRTYGDVRDLLDKALAQAFSGPTVRWCYVRDFTDTQVTYSVEGEGTSTLYQVGYEIADDGAVTFTGTPAEVTEHTTFEPVDPTVPPAKVIEAREHIVGRVTEAKGTDADGGRIFRVEILQYGLSKNGVNYTEAVMAAAARLYEGAKSFDRHRSNAELVSSTVAGLVGGFRNVEATPTALEADLHLLPSATHIAEAFDASIAAEAAGLPPLVGLSHDVALTHREAVIGGGRKIKEATAIKAVFSVDVVADPSAGGRVTRTVAGGICDTQLPEEISMTTLQELLAGASDEDKAALAGLLGGAPAGTETTVEPAAVAAVAEATTYERESTMGRLIITQAIEHAGLDERFAEAIGTQLGDRFTEADLSTTIETVKRVGESIEKTALRPGTPHISVTKEAHEKKVENLDRMLEGTGGYPSLKAAYVDFTGMSGVDVLSGDLAFEILRESRVHNRYEGMRQTESVDSTTWGQALADTLHRRLTAVYKGNNLQDWRKLVSSVVPRSDFRPNHVTRIGGYGVLPAVDEGDPYEALSSPPDEEATYALTKRGGTEDLTLETIANDDIGAVRRIPVALGRAAALTLYRFVIDTLFQANPTCGYDSVALFHASHGNTAAMALSQANLSVARRKMREQAQYGVAADVLGITPKYLWVPPELEELGFELCTSAVAITSNGDATIPNLHQKTELVVVDHWSDPTDWFVTADPMETEVIELGFFNGKEDPELFVADDPKVGTAFTNDKVTWKIRHIYSGTNVDHRGVQRGTVVDS